MRLTLTYDGPLLKRDGAPGKQRVRNQIQPQLADFWSGNVCEPGWLKRNTTWQDDPEAGGLSVLKDVKGAVFAPLVCRQLRLTAELDVLFLRPGRPGVLAGRGDIDNRLKVLFDALTVPTGDMLAQAPLPPGMGTEEKPYFTLLEDDDLVTKVSVETDELFGSIEPQANRAIIRATVRPTDLIFANMPFL